MVTTSDVKKKTFDQVLFFDTTSAKPKWTFSPDAKVFDVGVSGDGKYVAAVGSKIWLLTNKNNKPIWSADVGTSVFDSVALTPSGTLIAAGDRSSTVRLFNNTKSKQIKSWTLGSEDGVQSLIFSSDGKYILAGTHLSVSFINVAKTRLVWKFKPKKEHIEAVRLTPDGKHAAVTAGKTIYYFDTTKGTPLWSKTLKSTYPLVPRISDNGAIIVAGSDRATYVYNAKGKELWHFDLPNSLKGGVDVSGSGKYVLASQGKDSVYLFDTAYGGGRPFRFYTANRPMYVDMNRAGNLVTFGRYDLSARAPAPGVIVDQKSLPVYQADSDMTLRVFVTNPVAKNDNLKVKIALSLPQLNWWDQIASQKAAQSQQPSVRSKALDYLSEGLPGYSAIYDEPWQLGKQSSLDRTLTLTVPSLVMPQWLSDLLGYLDVVSPFADLLGDWGGPLKKLTGEEEANTTLGAANEKLIEANAILPLLGLGTVTIYDGVTNKVYDSDSFYFIYGL